MRYEPGAMALCTDPTLPKQMVTLVRRDRFAELAGLDTAWIVEFPAPVLWPYGGWDNKGGWSSRGSVLQKHLILIPDADPVETEREIEVVA